jgi:hypothetical protein
MADVLMLKDNPVPFGHVRLSQQEEREFQREREREREREKVILAESALQLTIPNRDRYLYLQINE